mgnify:FL=1
MNKLSKILLAIIIFLICVLSAVIYNFFEQKEALEVSLEEIKNMHEEINSLNAQISDLRSEER